MGSGYIIARENFKEAEKHVSAETDPVMFNLLYGLQSLTDQIEADFAALQTAVATTRASSPKKPRSVKPRAKTAPKKNNKGRGTKRRSR